MTFGALHHLEIYVSDLQKSHEFWSWLFAYLGWTTHQKWEAGFSYQKDGYYIVFVQVKEKYADAGHNRCQVGLNHLAFKATDEAQIDELTWQLKQKNIQLLYADRHPHAGGQEHYAVYFEDPDRIKVELTL